MTEQVKRQHTFPVTFIQLSFISFSKMTIKPKHYIFVSETINLNHSRKQVIVAPQTTQTVA